MVTSNGIYWHRSELAHEIKDESFQPTVNFTSTGLGDFSGIFLQCNLQLFVQGENGLIHVGFRNLLAVLPNKELSIATTRGSKILKLDAFSQSFEYFSAH